MHPFLLVPLFACLAAVGMAAAILSRDPGQRVNRLVAVVLVCSAWWSLCEVVWGMADDPETVRWLIKASSLGWLWLGPLCLEILTELAGDAKLKLRRLVPLAYVTAAASIVLYIATPWCVGEPVRVSWGWGITFGPLFGLVFVPTFGYVVLTLVMLPRFFGSDVSPGERREARWLMAGIMLPLTASTVTDALMPMLGHQVPRLGSTSLLLVGVIVYRSMLRYDFYLLAPGAFTPRILATLRDGVALLEEDGRIRSCNEGLERIYGDGPDSLLGMRIIDLIPGLDSLRNRSADSISEEPLELVAANRRRIPVEVSTSVLRDDEGGVIGRVVAARDLQEVETLRERLITAGRLAAVGELAAGIAHEINTPIAFVRSNLCQLLGHWETLAAAALKTEEPGLAPIIEEGKALLDESIEGVERVGAIVRDVGAFSHAGMGDPEEADINGLLENAVNVAALSHSAAVERIYEELPPVRCAPQQIKQLFLNLLLNALEAAGDQGRVRVTTRADEDTVIVRIGDDGGGIPEDALERIFDPFFTTRPGATGLGLAHCYQVVQRHGGEIRAESTPGKGATLEVVLPAAGL
jgi:PAS domain S-box-containing protein